MLNNALTLKIAEKFGLFIAGVMLLLTTLFPNAPGLMMLRQQRENSISEFGPKLIAAVEQHDIAAMKDLMCANIKNNVPDLDQKIDDMLNAIEGDILEITYQDGFNSFGEDGRDGQYISQQDYVFPIKTSTRDDQFFAVRWESVNLKKEEETGIRGICLKIRLENVGSIELANIAATEGIYGMHD